LKIKKYKVMYLKILKNGIIDKNPTFVLMLGVCPTLATTTSAANGIGMGLATALVLICSNIVLSAIKKFLPDAVRTLSCIIVIATFVCVLQMCMQVFVPDLYRNLGIFVPLIVVNCLVLGGVEVFASKNSIIASGCDGVGKGLGFTVALTLLGTCRELLGTGKVFGFGIFPETYGALIFILAPGAFIALGYLTALLSHLRRHSRISESCESFHPTS
jgi:electron transport complex protein RnfE